MALLLYIEHCIKLLAFSSLFITSIDQSTKPALLLVIVTLVLQQFPHDKTGSGGKKTLLTEEDLQNMAQDGMEM